MGKINKFSLIYSKNNHMVEITIFIILSILVCLISNSYSFNPFLLVLIYISYIRGINNYLFTVVVTILTSLLISIPYGVEIVIINVSFFLFCLIFCLFKKQSFFKKYGPFICTHLLFFFLSLIRSFSVDNIVNLSLSMISSFILLYGYLNLTKCILEENHEFESKAKVIVLATISLLFYGISGFYLLISRFIHLLICKTSSSTEGALAIIINCVFIYYLQNSSSFTLLTLIVPSLIAVFLNKKLVIPVYLFIYVFIYLYLSDNFYSQPSFYQGLLSILFVLIMPNDFIKKIDNVVAREEKQIIIEANNRLKEVSKSITDIISYLDVVLSTSIDTNYSPVDKTLLIIKDKVCSQCERKDKCHLYFVMKKSLEEEFTKEDKTKLFEECLYPYKIIRQLRINKATLLNEKKYHDEIKNKNDIYKQEIENIYKPLRNIFSKSEIITRKKTQVIEELEAYHFQISELIINNETMSFYIALDNKEDISKVLTIISNCMKRTYYLEDMFYILSLGLYQINIATIALYKVDVGISSYGLSLDYNGDSYLSFIEDNHYYLILSDGIGHNRNSSNVSFFMVNALNAYRKIEPKVENQITNINALLKSKINEEMYATLDYIDIDLIKGTLEIFKCGSFNSYLFRKSTLIKLKSNTPPLGIIYNIKTLSLVKELEENDILIFMTDGYLQEPEEIINEVLTKHNDLSSQELTLLLDNELLKHKEVDDDKTIIVIKFTNKKEFSKMKNETKLIT